MIAVIFEFWPEAGGHSTDQVAEQSGNGSLRDGGAGGSSEIIALAVGVSGSVMMVSGRTGDGFHRCFFIK